jgi:hypothetical protein
MNKLIILVICSNEPHYLKLEQIAKETWASVVNENIDIYFLHHDPEIKTSYIDGNIIYCKSEAGVENIGHKMIESFNLLKNYDFKYIFRTNLSSYIDQLLLYKHLNSCPHFDYGGVSNGADGIDFCSGAGYCISKKVLHEIVNNNNLWNHNLIDDVALGFIMKSLGFKPYGELKRLDVGHINENIDPSFYHYRFKLHYVFSKRLDEYLILKKIHDSKFPK